MHLAYKTVKAGSFAITGLVAAQVALSSARLPNPRPLALPRMSFTPPPAPLPLGYPRSNPGTMCVSHAYFRHDECGSVHLNGAFIAGWVPIGMSA